MSHARAPCQLQFRNLKEQRRFQKGFHSIHNKKQIPGDLRVQRDARLDSRQAAAPLPQVVQHHLAEPVVHVDLLVVDKDRRLEVRAEPLEQIVTVLGLDVHEYALGQEDGGHGEVDLGLLQLERHLVDVAQVDAHDVVVGRVQVGRAEAHFTVCNERSTR